MPNDDFEFRYLFRAEFRDGTILEQHPDDASRLSEGKNCFFDVLQKGLENVRTFSFMGVPEEGAVDTLTVDLDSGQFFLNGRLFADHSVAGLSNVRLVYFRRHQRHFNAGNGGALGHDISYHLGWQANNAQGKNVQKILQIV